MFQLCIGHVGVSADVYASSMRGQGDVPVDRSWIAEMEVFHPQWTSMSFLGA